MVDARVIRLLLPLCFKQLFGARDRVEMPKLIKVSFRNFVGGAVPLLANIRFFELLSIASSPPSVITEDLDGTKLLLLSLNII